MSQSDSFIDEVTEEVRRDRLFRLMRRYGWIAIVLVLLIVGGAAWNEYRKANERAEAQALGDAILAALSQPDPAARVAALDDAPASTPGQRAVVAMLAAAESASTGESASAATRLNEVAQSSELPQIYRDLARFKALALQAGALPPEERRAGFESLAVPGSGLRLLAEEQIALTYLEESDRVAALDVLRGIREDAEVTAGLRQRVTQLMVALGEEPEGAGAAAADSE